MAWDRKTVNFTKFGDKNVPWGSIPCTILTKFSGFMGSSATNPCFAFGGIRARGSEIMEFNLAGIAFSQKFTAPPCRESIVRSQIRYI